MKRLVSVLALAALLPVFGDVSDRVTWEPFKLSPLFAKGMVLAKDQPVRVFGAGSGEIVVTLGGKTVRTVARDGLWCAELPAMIAADPECPSYRVFTRFHENHLAKSRQTK